VAVGHRHIDTARVGTRRGYCPARIGVATNAATLIPKPASVEIGLVGSLDGVEHRGTRDAQDPSVAPVIRDATRR
jgi:hypothetical protein